jgi:thiamine pyrophosphate-dependent acetolactate synthase large subunit-like protein
LKTSLLPGTAAAEAQAIPLLARAGQVEIVCVSHGASKSIPSTGLAAHLSRHCKKVAVADLPMQHGGIAETLRAHASMARADLMVMGGYAHPRMLEIVLGGVTSDMLADAELPLFLSH